MSWSPAEGGREGEYEKGGKTVTVRDKMDAVMMGHLKTHNVQKRNNLISCKVCHMPISMDTSMQRVLTSDLFPLLLSWHGVGPTSLRPVFRSE